MFRENLMSAFFAKITIFLILIVIVISNSSFAEDDCNKLEDKVPCLASQGDTWAMYVIARREYDLARTTGDYSKAMEWAYKAKSERRVIVSRLLKMIYISLGKGLHKDPIEAYVWLEEALAESEKNLYVARWIRRLELNMTADQIKEAKERLQK